MQNDKPDKRVGRPRMYEARQDDPMSNYSIRLTSWHARYARRCGQGSLSEGLRMLIEDWARAQIDKA